MPPLPAAPRAPSLHLLCGVRRAPSPRRAQATATALALMALASCFATVQAASFDCRKASTWVEKTVCDDPELSALDEALAHNYNAMLASDLGDGARQHLRHAQREWLRQRNACRSDDCLRPMYRERVNSVCELPVVSGVHALCIAADDVRTQPRVNPAKASPQLRVLPLPSDEISGASCGLLDAQGRTLVSHRIQIHGQFVALELTRISPQALHWSGPNTEVHYAIRSGQLLQTREGFAVGRGPMGQLHVTHQGQGVAMPAREVCLGAE